MMETTTPALGFVSLITASLLAYSYVYAFSPSSYLGVHPLDEKYFASEIIECKDGLKSFTRKRLNDNYCDCRDGSDEPGTSACPAGRFYCQNVGSTPRFLFSSQVNDHICDCCDGSDENDGTMNCPKICIMGGSGNYKSEYFSSMGTNLRSLDSNEVHDMKKPEDLFQKVKGLKMLIVIQSMLVSFVVVFHFLRRHSRIRKRHGFSH